ncbi:MAG: hypothetical protein AAFX81_20015 [Pseudomonadota bacterium]
MARAAATGVLFISALLAGCALSPRPDQLVQADGLNRQIAAYYNARATERSFTCLHPSMAITGASIVAESDDLVTLSVRYFWREDPPPDRRFNACQGNGERHFVVERTGVDQARVVSMTGEQRPGRA